MAHFSPFSKQELMPLEECLLIEPGQSALLIGMPKENLTIEQRVVLTPEAVQTLCSHGHRIVVEKGAGIGANYTDLEYIKAGAEISADKVKIMQCPIIVKVSAVTEHELQLMAPYTLLWSSVQLKTLTKEYLEALKKKKISAIGLDFIKDKNNLHLASSSMSEIAGVASILIAAELMTSLDNKGKGLLLGNITGVIPTEIVILGAGVVAEFAARTAIAMGASVRIFDNSLHNLRRIQNNLPGIVSTSIIQEKILLKALMRCDVAIGALRGKHRTPCVVSQTMVENMKQGAVIIDVAINNGGCFETSELTTHESPTVIKNGVTHYGVPNITSRYSRTASMALSNMVTPLLLEYAEFGSLQNALEQGPAIQSGIYYYKGVLTHEAIAKWFDLEYRDIFLLGF